jgi:hypothetical protein
MKKTLLGFGIIIFAVVIAWVFVQSGATARSGMSGDASLKGDISVKYSFRLNCSPDSGNNVLDIRWGEKNRFELKKMENAVCLNDPPIETGEPFNTFYGEGIGTFNGQDGARAAWTFSHKRGEDLATFVVADSKNKTVLEVSGRAEGTLTARGAATLPAVTEADPETFVQYITLDSTGRTVHYEHKPLPEDTVKTEPRDLPFKPEELPKWPPVKIHPDIEKMLKEKGPDERTEVVIQLKDNLEIPRFPDLPRGTSIESPRAEKALKKRDEIIKGLLENRSRSTETFLGQFRKGEHDIKVQRQSWLVNSFTADISLGDIRELAVYDEVLTIHPRFMELLPPGCGGDYAVSLLAGRNRINSDSLRDEPGTQYRRIGLIDTGVDLPDVDHEVFTGQGNHIFRRGDCVWGGPTCLDENYHPNFFPYDNFNHGTAAAHILTGYGSNGDQTRGVTDSRVNSWKVWTHLPWPNTLDFSAVIIALESAIDNFDEVILVNVQIPALPGNDINKAANNAYNTGKIVIAPTGNCSVNDACTDPEGTPRPGTVRAPGSASKVIAVGAVDVVTSQTPDYQGYGPTGDGRMKPEIQAPTGVCAASLCEESSPSLPGSSMCAFVDETGTATMLRAGTSFSAPFAAGTAALIKNKLNYSFLLSRPGSIYARLILAGKNASPNARKGAGLIRLPSCGTTMHGMRLFQSTSSNFLGFSYGVAEFPIDVGQSNKSLNVAVWWPSPEGFLANHTDFDVQLIDPNGNVRASGDLPSGSFERIRYSEPGSLGSTLQSGTWNIRVSGKYFGSNWVYMAAHAKRFFCTDIF